ncbi:MAG TPA: VWA domain-containing protein [Bordetella sp.]
MTSLPAFGFIWPGMLWLLVLVPLLAGLYVWHDARRRGPTARYPALRMAGLAAARGAGRRRHLPPALMLLGLAALAVAVARPQADMALPSHLETVILAVDMSGSMKADDVKPSRFRAAQQIAKAFLDEQPLSVSVGVVAVAGTAAVAQPPTHKKDDVAAALDRLQPQRGSALGSGIAIALSTLLPQMSADTQRFMNSDNTKPPGKTGSAGKAAGAVPPGGAASEAAVPGSYASGAVVLLSDGEANIGPDTLRAAQFAADHGVRVYTVGIGTPQGTVLKLEGMSARVKLDDESLKQVAEITGAEYFRLEDAAELKKVYRTLSARLSFDKRAQVEISALFAALGALLAICAAFLSLWWYGRVL